MEGLNTHPEVLDHRERSLLIAHELADVLRVREATGHNDGAAVQEILGYAGMPVGEPWCASAVYYELVQAGVPRDALPLHPASVYGWVQWARDKSRLTEKTFHGIERGDAVFWLDGNHGHIFRFVKWTDDTAAVMETLEGNTGADGGREGDGMYRKDRSQASLKTHARFGYISLKDI